MNQIVKEFSFGNEGKDKVFKGIEKIDQSRSLYIRSWW